MSSKFFEAPIFIYQGTVTDVVTGHFGTFASTMYKQIELYFNSIVFVGGTSPTIVFKYGCIDAQGNLYNQFTSGAQSAGANLAQAIGQSSQANRPLGALFRIDYVLAGAPTSVSFYCEIVGRGF